MTTTASGLAAARESVAEPSVAIDFRPLLNDLNAVFASRKTRDYKFRVAQLKQMEKMMLENYKEIVDALFKDLGRPYTQALIADVTLTLNEVRFSLQNLKKWMAPESKPGYLFSGPSDSKVYKQPKGTVLIIGAWNFPFQLSLIPLVGAISAGCCAIVKPSEVAPNSATLIETLVNKYLDTSCYKVVQGGVPETTALLKLPFDHIFYTGNGAVGKIVMTAAAQHLTPVTLELGGKSPVIIDSTADLKKAVWRTLDLRYSNCGQICIAPEYVLCHRSLYQKFLDEAKLAIDAMFEKDASKSKAYARIVNTRHFDRISKLIETADGELVAGGLATANKEDRYIPPTVIANPTLNCSLMREEIFGPVLSVIPVDTIDDAIEFVNKGDRPLALYIFANDNKVVEYIIQNTLSGGVCVNDCVFHVTNPHIPFGGIGPSGMGNYHGKASFDTFSHTRGVMIRSNFDAPGRYPPLDESTFPKMTKFFLNPSIKTLLFG